MNRYYIFNCYGYYSVECIVVCAETLEEARERLKEVASSDNNHGENAELVATFTSDDFITREYFGMEETGETEIRNGREVKVRKSIYKMLPNRDYYELCGYAE